MYFHEIDFFNQSIFFIISLITGFLSGIIYSFFKALFSEKFSNFGDFLFVLLFCLLIINVNIIFQDAALRFFQLLGAGIGFIAYFKSIHKIIFKIFSLIFLPFKKLNQTIFKICKKIVSFLKNRLQSFINKVYNILKSFSAKRIVKADGKKKKKKRSKAV